MGSAEEFLLALPSFASIGSTAYRPGLERMRRLLDAMGGPERKFRSIHVAGTNGKGSVASMLAAIGTSLGIRTGLHTSPHLLHVTERMRVNGVPAEQSWLHGRVEQYRGDLEAIRPSFFEATAALSFLYFADRGTDWAVVEVGLGGRLDATNVLQPEVCAITRIGLDHTEILGKTVEAIAYEKAGIVKPGIPVVVYAAPESIRSVIRSVADTQDAPFHDADSEVRIERQVEKVDGLRFDAATRRGSYPGLFLELAGRHQLENVAVALRAAELAWGDEENFDAAVAEGLANVRRLSGLRGRLEILPWEPPLIVDVAHNPEGIRVALDEARRHVLGPDDRLHVVIALMADKDIDSVAALLADYADFVYCADVDSPRALKSDSLAGIFRSQGTPVVGVGSLESILDRIRGAAGPRDVVLATGSHLLVEAVLRAADAARTGDHGTAFE